MHSSLESRNNWYRRDNSFLVDLYVECHNNLTSHREAVDWKLVNLAWHTNLLSGEDQPTCASCDAPLTVKHTLLDCPDIQEIRQKYLTASSLKDIFESVDNQSKIERCSTPRSTCRCFLLSRPGIIMSNDLSPNAHINDIVFKAHQRDNLILRCLSREISVCLFVPLWSTFDHYTSVQVC